MRAEVQVNEGSPSEGDSCWHHMGVYVDGLIVNISQALDALLKRVRDRAEASEKKGIV